MRSGSAGWRTFRAARLTPAEDAAAPSRVHLATGILERDGRLLLVASRYPNVATPLWNLPGGRQRHGELLCETVRREFFEEVSLNVDVGALRYVSESYDRIANAHFLHVAYDVRCAGEPHVEPGDAHVVELAWVPRAELANVLAVAVVREPLIAHLADQRRQYFGYADAGITIEFAEEP